MISFKPIVTDVVCRECGLCWCKNYQYFPNGTKRHNGYYHRCKASGSGRFDGQGPFLRVGLDWKDEGWADKTGCLPRKTRDSTEPERVSA